MASSRRLVLWLLFGTLALLLAGVAGTLMGPVRLGPRSVVLELVDRLPLVQVHSGLDEREATILWQLRVPRVVLGALVGATLAISGAAYQGVFRNPLADPWTLGAAAGAGLGATIAIVYLPRVTSSPIGILPAAAFAGAMLAVGAAYILGRSAGGGRTATTLILAGVAIASFLTAMQTYLQQGESDTLREVYSWILGRLTTAGWSDVLLLLPYTVLSAVAILVHRRLLDVMRVGEEEAQALGVEVRRVRLLVVVAASLGTAAAVAVSGLIAFVGIIVPHAIRLTVGASYRLVLPLSLLFGGAFLVLADLAARQVAAPSEIPIGVVTAFFGAPFFGIVLWTSRKAAW